MSLQSLIAPMSVQDFTRTHWERKSLLVPGDPDRFAGLFGLKDIGRLLHYLKPSPPEGMLLVKGSEHYAQRWTNADGTPQPKYVRKALQEGYSLVVNGLERMWEPVERFSRALQADLHHPVDVNLYVTPPGTQAFAYHWDVMDVFVLQVEGSKAWKVHGAAVDRPFPDEHAPTPPDDLPPLVLEQDLQAGEVLYIPRGHVHAARTTNTTSIHLSVGVQPKTWIDLFAAAVNGARSDPRFRSALPPGYFNNGAVADSFREMAEALPGMLDPDFALGRLAQDWFVGDDPPPGDDFLGDEPDLTPQTVVRIRDGVICRNLAGPGYAGVQYSGGKIVGPAKIGPALRAIVEKRQLPLSALGDTLSDREAVVLARRLIRDGLLGVAGEGPVNG